MKVLTNENIGKLVASYVSERTGLNTNNLQYVGFGVFQNDGVFVAGVIVSNFRGTDCEISMAAETANWARKGVMRVIFEYIFYRMGCVRGTCIVKNVNTSKRTRRFLEGIGFVLEGNLRRGYDGESDALIYGLLREDCRFLGSLTGIDNGQEKRA